MENLYFILVPVVFISVFLVFKFFKMEQDYKSKSKEIQMKIQELKEKNLKYQDKKNVDHSKPKIWVEWNFYKFNSRIERIYD